MRTYWVGILAAVGTLLVLGVAGRLITAEPSEDPTKPLPVRVDEALNDETWWWREPRISLSTLCATLEQFETPEELVEWLGPRKLGNPSLSEIVACTYFTGYSE